MAYLTSKVVALKDTAQVVTSGWVAIGNPLNAGNYDKMIVRPIVVINSSSNVRFRLVERIGATGDTTTYLPSTEVTAGTEVKVTPQYKELDTDANQNPILVFDVKGLEYVQLQTQAGTVGATGASISSVYYNFVKET